MAVREDNMFQIQDATSDTLDGSQNTTTIMIEERVN
jgi:hypothetical protein